MLTQSYLEYFAKKLKKRYFNHSSIEMIEISIDIFAQLKLNLNFVSNINPMLVLENEFKDVKEDYKKAYQNNVDFCRDKNIDLYNNL